MVLLDVDEDVVLVTGVDVLETEVELLLREDELLVLDTDEDTLLEIELTEVVELELVELSFGSYLYKENLLGPPQY